MQFLRSLYHHLSNAVRLIQDKSIILKNLKYYLSNAIRLIQGKWIIFKNLKYYLSNSLKLQGKPIIGLNNLKQYIIIKYNKLFSLYKNNKMLILLLSKAVYCMIILSISLYITLIQFFNVEHAIILGSIYRICFPLYYLSEETSANIAQENSEVKQINSVEKKPINRLRTPSKTVLTDLFGNKPISKGSQGIISSKHNYGVLINNNKEDSQLGIISEQDKNHLKLVMRRFKKYRDHINNLNMGYTPASNMTSEKCIKLYNNLSNPSVDVPVIQDIAPTRIHLRALIGDRQGLIRQLMPALKYSDLSIPYTEVKPEWRDSYNYRRLRYMLQSVSYNWKGFHTDFTNWSNIRTVIFADIQRLRLDYDDLKHKLEGLDKSTYFMSLEHIFKDHYNNSHLIPLHWNPYWAPNISFPNIRDYVFAKELRLHMMEFNPPYAITKKYNEDKWIRSWTEEQALSFIDGYEEQDRIFDTTMD